MSTADIKNFRFWPIMAAIFFGSFLSILGISMINIALPILMKDFNTSLSTIQWTLTGFMLSMGTIAPLTSYLGDKFGYKNVYLYSLVGFIAFSLLCGFAWSAISLIIFRILQGIFSGLVLPATMTIIFQVIPREKQAFAISLWALSAMLAPAFGPTISGLLIQGLSWQWLFFINVPIGIIAIFFIIFMIPNYRMSTAKSLDKLGLITVMISSIALLVGLSEGRAWGWTSWRIMALFIIGLISLVLFIRRELTTAEPMLDLRVFRNFRFSITLITSTIITISLYSGTLLIPLFLQNVQHVTPLDTGLILLPASLVMAIAMPFAGKIYGRVGPRVLTIVGVVLIAFGSLEVSWLSNTISHGYIIFWMTVRNLGVAFASMASSTAGMAEIPAVMSGHASAVNNWIRNVAGSFAIALFTTLLASNMTKHIATETQLGEKNPLTIQLFSYTMSINDVFWVATIIALIAIPFSLIIGKKYKKLDFVNTVEAA
ncbi:MAG: drug resistance transporter, EmrB/QacA subfamily [Bacilli bacterium]|nr:drug resistance transporter, EmrB/QacA subfamily [Bacilli bacterium]